MSENGTYTKSEILRYIEKGRFVRVEKLIDYFENEDPKKGGSKGANNNENKNKKSRRTIKRYLKEMTKEEEGPLVILNKEQVKRYGIDENDGRAKYLALKETVERERYLDQVFELLSTGDNIDKKTALNEIKHQQEYILYSSQLDVLVSNLDNKDPGFIEDLFYILHNHIIIREISPENGTNFLEMLRNLLKQYEEGHENYITLRSHIIWFLGYYNDKAVIEQLKKDIEAGRLSKLNKDYLNIFTARVIEEARTELFYLENRLRKEGDIETADILGQIRRQAAAKAEKPKKGAYWESTFIGKLNTKN